MLDSVQQCHMLWWLASQFFSSRCFHPLKIEFSVNSSKLLVGILVFPYWCDWRYAIRCIALALFTAPTFVIKVYSVFMGASKAVAKVSLLANIISFWMCGIRYKRLRWLMAKCTYRCVMCTFFHCISFLGDDSKCHRIWRCLSCVKLVFSFNFVRFKINTTKLFEITDLNSTVGGKPHKWNPTQT